MADDLCPEDLHVLCSFAEISDPDTVDADYDRPIVTSWLQPPLRLPISRKFEIAVPSVRRMRTRLFPYDRGKTPGRPDLPTAPCDALASVLR